VTSNHAATRVRPHGTDWLVVDVLTERNGERTCVREGRKRTGVLDGPRPDGKTECGFFPLIGAALRSRHRGLLFYRLLSEAVATEPIPLDGSSATTTVRKGTNREIHV
jgi:hypothetical protein